MRNYYFLPSNAGTSVSEDGSAIKITTTQNLAKLNTSAKTNDFAIELKVLSASGNVALGIGNYSTSPNRNKYTGAYSDGCSINISDGTLYFNNLVVATVSNFIAKQNDIVALRVDSKNNIIEYFKNGVLVYTYKIQFPYQNLIFEVGTGTQTDGEIQINYEWVYNYNSLKYDLNGKRLVLKNPTTNQHYSLSDNTLIHLPDNTTESIIEYGVEKGRHIQLDTPFTKHRYFNDTPVANENGGKVFTHDVGVINTLSIKEFAKNKEFKPIFTWYETNMTSNTSPSPLVASSSSEYNTTYQAWRAFDGIKDVNAWLTVSNTTTGWIKLDFGRKVLMNVLKMTCRGGTTDAITKAMPKDFEIYGSNDDSTYTLLGTINNQTNWSFLEERLFAISNSTEYRYLRLNILNNNGSTEYSNIGELIYGYKREVN